MHATAKSKHFDINPVRRILKRNIKEIHNENCRERIAYAPR